MPDPAFHLNCAPTRESLWLRIDGCAAGTRHQARLYKEI